MLRNEILSISVTSDSGTLGLHVVAMDDRGTPRHSEYTATSKKSLGPLLGQALKRWLENRWTR
jgi:hypothetical protein